MMLDDASSLVRQAMAEVFARAANAPAAIVRALSLDQVSVALPILEHSPLLLDTDLVGLIRSSDCEAQCAIARRVKLTAPVCAVIAEIGTAAAALELIQNAYAELAPSSWDRIVERHGQFAAIRESMLVLEDLPATTRLALTAKLSDTLAQFVVARQWLGAARAGRMASDARERSVVTIAARSRKNDMHGLVRHLRVAGQLTAGLILRALLSGNLELFDCALVELSGVPQRRVSALLYDGSGTGIDALLTRAGLPVSTFPAFRGALEAIRETGFVGTAEGAAQLRRRMVERVLTRCETDAEAAEPLLILLRRFATESAREEARALCRKMKTDNIIATIQSDLIAA